MPLLPAAKYEPRQIPDSAWARFRGLARLRHTPHDPLLITSAAVARQLRFEWIVFVNAWLLRFT